MITNYLYTFLIYGYLKGESDEEVQFMQLYYEFERNMSSLPHSAIDSLTSEIDIVSLKEEMDDELYSTVQDSSSLDRDESIHSLDTNTITHVSSFY